MSASVRRLYKELKPLFYELLLVPDAKSLTFTGEIVIRLKKTGRPSQRITFHQHGLRVSHAEIIKRDKKGLHPIPVIRINNQDTLDEVRLHTKEMVPTGEYEIRMHFEGRILRNMTGLYPCYFTHDGKEHILLATQFESHHAREAFPCIDEPEAKATFKLSLVAPKEHHVLANTPIETQEPYTGASDGSLIRTTFETTPRMSSYLLAFAIGEIHSKRARTTRGTEVAVWGTIAQPTESFAFALDVATRCIEFFEAYFEVDYPLAKADHIALPDFSTAAMENWGLITYRERALLAYPNEAAQSTKERIAEVIAHETSHQWFGNLVTMRWWDDLWLNESFADIMGYEAPAALFPRWHVWDEFVANEGFSALRRDATKGVQAIQTTVHHPDEIGTLFDPSIVYAKGGRLLYMLKTYIGEAAFRQGLSTYFKKHAYGSTTGNDLWQALQASSDTDVAAFMNPWLERPGFPVVSINQQGRTITLQQSHFLESGEASDERIWPIPLFSNRTSIPALMRTATLHRTLPSDEPVLLNQGAIGHYIVNYVQPQHREHIANLARTKSLGVGERFMLLNNASMLAKAGYQSFGSVLKLLSAYQDEDTEVVWGAMALITAEARRFIDLEGNLEMPIKILTRTLIQHQYTRLGWTGQTAEPPADQKLRATILALGGYSEDKGIIAKGLEYFEMYKQGATHIDPELRGIIFSIAVKQKVPDAFSYLLQLYDETANGDLQGDCMAALTVTRDIEYADKLLSRLTDASMVKPQDADSWLASLLQNRHTRETAWNWMVANWQWIKQTYSSDKSYDYFPRYAAAVCNTQEWADKYTEFFTPKQDEIMLRRNIAIALTEVATRVQWLKRDLPEVRNFFNV